ncbi:MAG TPA: group I intron-associated PD-(D/E)XK endonuclease [Gaiellaceae bacterium]|nr:group I intron-associated PD-(D/E)XK endonuclease [Gaiellaceae bacterium]
MLTTNQKGAIAETAVIHEAIKLGIGVYVPIADEPSDLILDLGSRLLRVQCKWAVRTSDVIVIRTRRCRRGREGLIHRSYSADEIDVIAAYCPDTNACYLLPQELSVDRVAVQLRLEPPRNNQIRGIKWARDYELRATLIGLLGP